MISKKYTGLKETDSCMPGLQIELTSIHRKIERGLDKFDPCNERVFLIKDKMLTFADILK